MKHKKRSEQRQSGALTSPVNGRRKWKVGERCNSNNKKKSRINNGKKEEEEEEKLRAIDGEL